MSFDLFAFERRDAIRTSEDVLAYLDEFTVYTEDTDYNSLDGCSQPIAAWAKKMFEKFAPMNGPDAAAYGKGTPETHFADYSLGAHGVFCVFGNAMEEEALAYAVSIADACGVGIYDPQSNDAIHAAGLPVLMYRTGHRDDVFCGWDNIETAINCLEEDDFITVWFEVDGAEDGDCIQCMAQCEKRGLLQRLFAANRPPKITGYHFEILKDDCIAYQTTIESAEELKAVMKAWCREHKEPDLSTYERVQL